MHVVLSGLVAVGVSHAGSGIQHAFVLHHGVGFSLEYGVKRLVSDVPYDVMGVVDSQRSGVIKRLVDVFSNQVLDALKVEDGLSPGIEGETTYLSAFLSQMGMVGVMFGSANHEFVNDVSFEFVFELAQETSSREVGLALGGQVDHRVGVHVQDAGEQGMQPVAIEFDASVGGGEGGDEDVGVGMSSLNEWWIRWMSCLLSRNRWNVVRFVWHGPHVLLQCGHVKKVRKEPFGFLLQSESLRKQGAGHGEKVQTVDEFEAPGNQDAQ